VSSRVLGNLWIEVAERASDYYNQAQAQDMYVVDIKGE
jgi:hypothetical protein